MPNYKAWLEKIKKAWESKDYTLLATMFPDRLTYFESPFLSQFTTKQQVVDEWKKGLEKQQDIHFDSDILYENDNECFAHWIASFVRNKKIDTLDGVFHFRLNEKHECTYFKMWWVAK